jgi:hypothetical protein
MCVCVCGIEPSSLVNERGKGLSGKKTRKKKTIYTQLELDIYSYIQVYIYSYIYIYIGIWEEGGLCAVYISVYISAYISVYITGRGRRLVCRVHSYAPPLTAAIVYRYVYRYIPIYRYIEEGVSILRPQALAQTHTLSNKHTNIHTHTHDKNHQIYKYKYIRQSHALKEP